MGSAERGGAPCLLTPGPCGQPTDSEPRLETVLHRWPGRLSQSPTRKAAVGFYPHFTAGETETSKPVPDGDCPCLLWGRGITHAANNSCGPTERREKAPEKMEPEPPRLSGAPAVHGLVGRLSPSGLGAGDLIQAGEGRGLRALLCPRLKPGARGPMASPWPGPAAPYGEHRQPPTSWVRTSIHLMAAASQGWALRAPVTSHSTCRLPGR